MENVVGRGGFAGVYKGKLRSEEAIAVKRLTKVCKDAERKEELLNETGTMGHVCGEKFPAMAWKTDVISKRHDATTLETVDGFTIALVGFIDKDLTQQNGFSDEPGLAHES